MFEEISWGINRCFHNLGHVLTIIVLALSIPLFIKPSKRSWWLCCDGFIWKFRVQQLKRSSRSDIPYYNRSFPSSLVALFQSESKCETIFMKMELHAELIFIWKVSNLDSFWNIGTRELGNGLFYLFLPSHLRHSVPIGCQYITQAHTHNKSFSCIFFSTKF